MSIRAFVGGWGARDKNNFFHRCKNTYEKFNPRIYTEPPYKLRKKV